jgi:hypothetical protein
MLDSKFPRILAATKSLPEGESKPPEAQKESILTGVSVQKSKWTSMTKAYHKQRWQNAESANQPSLTFSPLLREKSCGDDYVPF